MGYTKLNKILDMVFGLMLFTGFTVLVIFFIIGFRHWTLLQSRAMGIGACMMVITFLYAQIREVKEDKEE